MPTYNIYPYVNAREDVEPTTTVEISDDGTRIISVKSHGQESQEDAERMLKTYVESGFTPVEAVERYAGSYGKVTEVNPDGSPMAVSETPYPSIDNGIMAMTADDGVVVTLFKTDEDGGAFFRHDGEWKTLVDPRTMEDLAFVGVQDSALDLYDKHEAEGNLVPIKFYPPSADGPYWPVAIPLKDDELVDDEEEDDKYRR